MPVRNRRVALSLSSPCAGHACPGQGELPSFSGFETPRDHQLSDLLSPLIWETRSTL